MSAVDLTAETAPVSVQRSNIARLAIAQALAGANSTVVYATGAVVGAALAPSRALTTLPITVFVIGMAACIVPSSLVARRYGRKGAFLVGAACGVLTGLIAALAVMVGSFWLFCLATLFAGAYAAVVLSFRFAAADGVAPERRARALSMVMAGGVAAGVVGPQLVNTTMHLWASHMFVATFLAQAAVAALSAVVLQGVRLPPLHAAAPGPSRTLGEIARDPRFITAALCGAITYMLMNFLMTAAPLAMRICGHPQEASNLAIQWHVIAMYTPSFVTGRLIERFGAERVIATGLLLTAAATMVGLTGIDVAHFWLTLILLGVGWNFGFLGASALVFKCYAPAEKARVQALNDFIVFGVMAAGSLTSGALLSAYGWRTVLWASLLPLALAVVTLGLSAAGSRRAACAIAKGAGGA